MKLTVDCRAGDNTGRGTVEGCMAGIQQRVRGTEMGRFKKKKKSTAV